MTRTVQARQRGKCIFTTTCSFMRESKDQNILEHEWDIPEGAIDGLDEMIKGDESGLERGETNNRGGSGLYAVKPLPMVNSMIFRS